jgi:hypothetical protein
MPSAVFSFKLFLPVFIFGERQMVIWLDSNSNLCKKNIFINGEVLLLLLFFLSMGKNKKKLIIMIPGNQPETSIFQLMSLFVRVSHFFFAISFSSSFGVDGVSSIRE